jgi:hypothetical protein
VTRSIGVLLIGFLVACAGQEKSWTECKSLYSLKLEVTTISAEGKVTVRMSNVSKQPLRVWQETNTWGAANWRLLVYRAGRLETYFQEYDYVNYFPTANTPDFDEIGAGAYIERKLDLNETHSWERWGGTRGGKVEFKPGDLVIVVYDVPATPAAKDLSTELPSGSGLAKRWRGVGVWYGATAASTIVR